MEKQSVSLAFTGDIGFDRYMAEKWKDPELLSQSVIDFCRSADHVVANVEGALINAVDDGHKGVFFHNMNPEAVCMLDKIGADIWCIGNNHIMDAGRDGVTSTKALAKEKNCRTIGAGLNETEASEPTYLSEAGGIGILSVGYMPECIRATDTEPGVFGWDHMERIAARIAEVKSKCRWCIVISHGGEEFTDMPNPYTRARYMKYLEMGADVVVAHHPHVPENYELFENGKAIFYSLSNFIFDTDYQRVHPYTDRGILLKLTFTEDDFKIDALGTKIVRGEQHIVEGPLPEIFTNIDAEEYEKLSPLSAKVFLEEEKKRQIFLHPDKHSNKTEAEWQEHFNNYTEGSYVKNEHMDLAVVLAHAKKAEDGAWKESKLDAVIRYMTERNA